MNTIVDLGSELLIDRSRIRDPYLRLMLTAIGHELVRGSPWIAVDKQLAARHGVPGQFMDPQGRCAVAQCA
jgi:hypothetical protein